MRSKLVVHGVLLDLFRKDKESLVDSGLIILTNEVNLFNSVEIVRMSRWLIRLKPNAKVGSVVLAMASEVE